jgi:UDP:flavonoid glycosyltransferase YjiC (YdhE family)
MDQEENAKMIERFGICKKAPFKDISSCLMIKYVNELLSDDVKKRCEEVSEKIHETSSEKLLLELT